MKKLTHLTLLFLSIIYSQVTKADSYCPDKSLKGLTFTKILEITQEAMTEVFNYQDVKILNDQKDPHEVYIQFADKKEIRLKAYQEKNYFFATKPIIASLLGSKKSRKYFILYGPEIVNCSPNLSAIKSILVHELKHIADYEKMSSLGVAKLGLDYLLSKKYHRSYERSTDEFTINFHQGKFACGLRDYRAWIDQWIILNNVDPTKALDEKHFFYLTKEEIEAKKTDCLPTEYSF